MNIENALGQENYKLGDCWRASNVRSCESSYDKKPKSLIMVVSSVFYGKDDIRIFLIQSSKFLFDVMR